ncbi:trypsin-like peptidase domain-containing protein [Kordia sp. YSTF-M3]|uniref:Trypsin-like peptidase domain-containing protein n=1 Tax=Kordia aestuariivivens TaxID=2759037 RepID=A0ABR7QBC2_9FLAO|nr:trypsin-like peptidase domain-containing protein [Kordia aestuariivivens]MBC8755882.1 trypsin-like peptidase domain-containing protein [Kordia aestuariivivens]
MKYILHVFILLITLQGFSQTISTLYEQSSSSVVLIKTMQTNMTFRAGIPVVNSLSNYGSGFVISNEGEILTASHLVQTAEKICVIFTDGEELLARVLYSYPLADVALIKIITPKSTPLVTVKLGNSDHSRIGDQVFIIGAPFGLRHSLSVGYISRKYKREPSYNGLVTTEFFQSDAAINKGSSGGPMFNMKGEVIGIVSFLVSQSHGFQGFGFAASSNIAKKLLLEEHAIWTGLEANFISGPIVEVLNVPQKGGILIQKVAPFSLGSIMELQGGIYEIIIENDNLILGGDIILTLDDIQLVSEESVLKAWYVLQGLKLGDSLRITILRKGKILEIKKEIPDFFFEKI